MSLTVERGGAVALIVTESGNILVVPDRLGENSEKEEKLGWLTEGGMRSVDGMRQFAGGVQGEGEEKRQVAIREIWEETLITPDPCRVVSLGVSTLIFHKRLGDGGELYGVELFQWLVNAREEAELRDRGAIDATEVPDQMRERDRIALQLYYQVVGTALSEFVPILDEVVQ